jgi:4-amino-4-deoxy-L-arabinose transferase-like glycosyltransferase
MIATANKQPPQTAATVALPPHVSWLCIALIIALFVIRNLPWHLDNYDQAKQAYVSFEMVERGSWLYQHTPDQDIATKPPLAGWISAAIYYATRSWDAAWRLPSFISAVILLMMLYRAGEKLSGQPGALMAAAAFGLNLFTPRLATLVRTDMLLTLLISAIGLRIFFKIHRNEQWTTRDRIELFLLLVASMLTKGPIAYAFLLPGLIAFWWFARRFSLARHAWSGWMSWTLPLVVFLAWVVIGVAENRELYDQVVLKEFLGRFTSGEEAVHKPQPIYFYVTHLLHKFAPWSVLLLACLFVKSVRQSLRKDPALLWLVCWALGGLIVMSIIPSKRPDRIFPVIPPLCLFLAAGLPEISKTCSWSARKVLACFLIVGFLISGGYTFYKVKRGFEKRTDALVEFGSAVRTTMGDVPLEIVNAKDEGLLLYVRKLQFIGREAAELFWNAGKIEGLVIDSRQLKKHAARFPDHRVLLVSEKSPDASSHYSLIVRKSFDDIPE